MPPSPGGLPEAARGHIWFMITISGSRPLHRKERPMAIAFPPQTPFPASQTLQHSFLAGWKSSTACPLL